VPVESCDGNVVPSHVGGASRAGRSAWPHRFRHLHSLRTSLQAPHRPFRRSRRL